MNKEAGSELALSFVRCSRRTEIGLEYWHARDLQHLLSYKSWKSFLKVISKAKTACDFLGHSSQEHFTDICKLEGIGSGGQQEIRDILLSRLACHLIAQNGNSRKPEITCAQIFFSDGKKLDNKPKKRQFKWYDDPEAAEADIIEHYRKLTPQQRLDEMMELLNKVGGWNERRLERVARFIDVPQR